MSSPPSSAWKADPNFGTSRSRSCTKLCWLLQAADLQSLHCSREKYERTKVQKVPVWPQTNAANLRETIKQRWRTGNWEEETKIKQLDINLQFLFSAGAFLLEEVRIFRSPAITNRPTITLLSLYWTMMRCNPASNNKASYQLLYKLIRMWSHDLISQPHTCTLLCFNLGS